MADRDPNAKYKAEHFDWIDLDDVPELLVAIENRLVLSGDATGTVSIDSIEFV